MYVAHCTQTCTRMMCGTPTPSSMSHERAIAREGHRPKGASLERAARDSQREKQRQKKRL